MGSSGISDELPDCGGSASADISWQPLVSVIVPTYNRSGLLRRAIQSVLRQTYARLEIIVVDDASHDNTATVVQTFSDARIRYVRHDRNRGGAAARNTGVRCANGDYIAFLDDDDQWAPEKTSAQLTLLRDYHVVLCTGDRMFPSDRVGERVNVQLDDLRHGKFTAGGTGVLMARADVLRETMFDESLPRYQDWDIFIRIALKHRVVYLNRALVLYNDGGHARITNSVLALNASELERQFSMLRKHRQFFGEPLFRRHMCRALLYGVKHRRDRWAHLFYVLRHYGVLNTFSALWARVRTILQTRVLVPTTAVFSAHRS